MFLELSLYKGFAYVHSESRSPIMHSPCIAICIPRADFQWLSGLFHRIEFLQIEYQDPRRGYLSQRSSEIKHTPIMADAPPPVAAGAPPTQLRPPPPTHRPTPPQEPPTAGVAPQRAINPKTLSATKPPMCVIFTSRRASAQGSTVSALTDTLTSACTPVPEAGRKRPPEELPSDESPSSKKNYPPDFTKPQSDDSSVLSGNNEEGWAAEEARITALVAEQNAVKEGNADEEVDDGGIAEVSELEQLLEDEESGGGEEEDVVVKYENKTIQVTYSKKWTLPKLQEIAKALNLTHGGTKRVLFDRIRDVSHPAISRLVDAEGNQKKDEFSYRLAMKPEDKNLPRWVILIIPSRRMRSTGLT